MSIIYHHDIVQGSSEWHELRRGIITASTAGTLITPTGKIADNDSVRKLAYKLAAERITGRVEKSFISYEMERGNTEEGFARDLYSKTYAPVTECGFIESTELGFRCGYSPDGLINKESGITRSDGLIEIKSRQSKYQIQTICSQSVPSEYMLQLQFGLWVSKRKWIDFVQYSNGMAMYRHEVTPDHAMFEIITNAVTAFEARVVSIINDYKMKSEGLPMAEYIQHVDGSEIEVSDD